MPNHIRLILALHNHQPIGNFEHVFQQAYESSYLPFLDVFDRYPSLRIALHTSGSLMEWLVARHGEYVDRLAQLAGEGRIEVLGGAFYEPILAMIPSGDRIGQIRAYSRWLQNRLGTAVRGMWVPERVWEQALARDLADAGIEYTILDDFHFKMAGLTDAELTGYLLTEDEGRLLSVFPGSERLRYLIPFGSPEQTIEYLAKVSEEHPDAVMVLGDDGEKFGSWPETKKHVYDDGWLVRFFDALVANQDWIQVTTPAEAIDNVPPLGKIYLPDCSYREMTEWSLPTEQLLEYERVAHELKDEPRWSLLRRFLRGGFWRNFKTKYPEADEMYSRMMMVSRRLQEAVDEGAAGPVVEEARTQLYRGQCNCGYWHGAFGGIYLPHLRNAVYHSLIAADNLLDRAAGRPETWVDATAEDFNFDARQEVRLSNDKLMCLLAPSRGGQLLELDVPQDPTQPAGHAHAPARSLSSQGPGRRQPPGRTGRQHPRPRGLQAGRPGPADPVRQPSAEEPLGPLLRQRRHAWRRWPRARPRCGATSSTRPMKPASAATRTASRCNWSAKATPAACRCGSPRA